MATAIRTQAVKLGNTPSTLANVIKNNNCPSSTPVLLNSKNILPKSSAQILNNNSIKLTQKMVGGSVATTNVSMSGKTAVRTSSGQIIYIQKTSSTPSLKTHVAPATTTAVKSQTACGNNPKPVTIQVLRTADGNYIPLKTTTPVTSGKNTLTLSPTSLAGKKIMSSVGGQVIIKGTIKPTDTIVAASTAKTITTNAITGVRTMVKPITSSTLATAPLNDLNKSKPILVHGASGKQIIVPNQNIVKLSPKTQTIATTAMGSSVTTTTTSGSGQIHAIQIPGKIGVQYVRVLPNTKVPIKNSNTSSSSSNTATTVSSAPAKTLTTTKQPIKILNPLPQKFTVVQKGGTTKLVVAQKKDAPSNNNNNTETLSKMQKTIVTVPTIKSLSDDKNKTSPTSSHQQSLIKSTQQSLLTTNNIQSNARKHKISEINSEIQRLTTSSTDSVVPPENKKAVLNSKVVVVANNIQPKILNNSIQPPGRNTSSVTLPTNTSSANKTVAGSMVQVVNVTQNGNKLYTVLKNPTVDQKTGSKLYSVLKTSNQPTPTTPPTSTTATATQSAKGITKPLINKQQLMQQHQKLLQLKQRHQEEGTPNEDSKSMNTPTPIWSRYMLPIKIKEEPDDSTSKDTNNINTDTTSAQLNLPTPMEEDSDTLDPLVGGVRRKHCNCSKSQCLKLYCDCFANGEFCQDCTCKDCFNNLENEDERQRAIKACLERNPNAFKPKITSSRDQGDMRLHNKGCNCKRSGCLKNYCECYEAKIPCSSNCKCVGCRNVEDRPDLDMDPIDPKIMATIAMGGNADNLTLKRTYEKTQKEGVSSSGGIAIKTEKLSKEPMKFLSSYDAISGAVSPTLDRQECNFITQEVIDATIQCMITQADECEKNSLPAYQTEKMVMEELGRCLVEIIDFSIRNTDKSYSQD